MKDRQVLQEFDENLTLLAEENGIERKNLDDVSPMEYCYYYKNNMAGEIMGEKCNDCLPRFDCELYKLALIFS